MERILQSEEMAGLIADACTYERKVFYYPIRHHSPVCAYHLRRVIEEYQPECILVEGPVRANKLMDVMADEDTKAPFAVYYSYADKKGLISDEHTEYKCYYPFLDYSPELVAIREAKARQIPCSFFDLPYEEILISCMEGKGLRREAEKSNYNDDRYLAENDFFQSLVKRSGLRNFDEFWERYFEIEGLGKDPLSFVGDMLLYCAMSRSCSGEETLAADGCLARERFMYEQSERFAQTYTKVLVVTGGFHSAGLLQLEKGGSLPPYQMHKIPDADTGTYVMAYSMEAADRLNGYASGMPHPAFYQTIWEQLIREKTATDSEDTAGGSMSKDVGRAHVYPDTVLHFLVSVGKKVRQRSAYPSTSDEVSACHMSENLAALRGKDAPGVYELRDSVLACYVKGEYNLATDRPMRTLQKLLAGDQVGRLAKNAKMPPLVACFEEACRRYRLTVGGSARKEVTLSVYANERHREISAFFYQMDFLNTGFAKRVKGPNLRLRKDRNLIREIWSYKWSSGVVAELIDASVYGGTIPEACAALALKKLREEERAEDIATLLIQLFEMGLEQQMDATFARLQEAVVADADFFSLVGTFSSVTMLLGLRELYRSHLPLEGLVEKLYRKILAALPHMGNVKDEDLEQTLEAIRELYMLFSKEEYRQEQENFSDALHALLGGSAVHAGLEGAVHGIFYAYGQMSVEDICACARGYMQGTKDKRLLSATYLRGLIFMAKDVILVGDDMVALLDEYVAGTEPEHFRRLLPQFRFAFSSFTPAEIDSVAAKVAKRYEIKKSDFWKLKEVSPDVYTYGRGLEEEVLRAMER